jgi:hypothetical protein
LSERFRDSGRHVAVWTARLTLGFGLLSCSPQLKSGSATFRAKAGDAARTPSPHAYSYEAYLKAPSPQASAWFGYALATDGSREGVAVAAPLEDVTVDGKTSIDAGAAYVFEPTGDYWSATRLVAPNPDRGDGLVPGAVLPRDVPLQDWGSLRLEINDEMVVLAVAAEASANPKDPSNNDAPYSGAVYVYDRDALFGAPQYLKAPTPAVNALFGTAVSLDGSRLAVGAPQMGENGAVYVYDEIPGTRRFGSPSVLTPPSSRTGSLFGLSIVLRGDLMVVGAPGEDEPPQSDGGTAQGSSLANTGAVYVFRSTNGSWGFDSRLTATPPAKNAFFGFSVTATVDGRTAAIGAPGALSCDGVTGVAARGAAYVATNDAQGGGFAVHACLEPAEADGVLFGFVTRLVADDLFVAAPWDMKGSSSKPDASISLSGAAYSYGGVAGTTPRPSRLQYLKSPAPDINDIFANDLSPAAAFVAIGAPRESGGQTGRDADIHDNSVRESGAVYLFGEPRR